MQEGLSAPVIGPSTILPRGYLWLPPLWYLAAAAALAVSRWPPPWFRASAAAGLLGALLTLVLVLSTLSVNAFAVDETGVRLGLPASTRRRGRRRRQARQLPWSQIERVRMSSRPYGARLEFLLSEDAAASSLPGRGGRARTAGSWLLMLVIPFWYLFRPTGLASPLDGPPRYRVTVRGRTVDELRHSIRALAPSDVAVAILVRRR
jgi:hypothetical protein